MTTIFFTLLILVLFSCEDDASTPATPPIPMVQTEELKGYTHGTLTSHTKNTYTYDIQRRVTAIMAQNILSTTTSTIVYDYSIPNQVKVGNQTYLLDANGRATQFNQSPSWSVNYTYDTNGYLISSSDSQYNYNYTYSNNNLSEFKITFNSGGSLENFEKFSHNNLPNTIGNENKGIKFLGKSNANFISGRQKVAGSNPLYSYNYSSSYDANNRLTNYSWTRIGGNQGASFQASYTYYP